MCGVTRQQKRKADRNFIRRCGRRDDESVIFIGSVAYAELQCSGIVPRRGSVTAPVCKFSAIFIRPYDDTAMWRRRHKADRDFLSAACGDTNGCSAETAMQRLRVNLA